MTTLSIFGQEQQFFINDSLVDFQSDKCWTLIEKVNASNVNNYDFSIENIEIIDNNLNLDISYGGGCGPVHLKLYVDNSYDLINEPIIRLYPEFLDSDFCKAIKYRKVCFDLNLLLKGRTKQLLLQIDKYKKIITIK